LNIKAGVMDLEQALQFDARMAAALNGPALIALGAALRQEERAL